MCKANALVMWKGLIMANHVVTFANSTMSHMHRRFARQARGMKVFENIFCWTEADLEPRFRENFAHVLTPQVRGFGYFVWKPQVILQALERTAIGDVLLYLDSGSHLVTTGRDRFLEYVEVATRSESGVLAFQLTHIEKEWSKGDLLEFFGVRNQPLICDTQQIQAGAIFIHHRPGVREFFEDWLETFSQRFDLVDDTPSLSSNDEAFVAHRHDQSVFSILAKMRGVSYLSALEQYPPGNPPDWESLRNFPIHHRRDKRTLLQKFATHIREASRPIELLLVRLKRTLFHLLGIPR